MKSVLKFTGQVDLIHESISENIKSEFAPVRLEMNQLSEAFSQLKMKSENASSELTALSQRLNQHMDSLEPVEIKDVDLMNQY